MKRLTTEQILMLHSQLIMTTGGLDGVRDKGLVDSSLSSAFEVYLVSNAIQQLKRRQRDCVIH